MASDTSATEFMAGWYLNQDQGPHILAATWLMTALATVVVAGRFYIRYAIIKRGGADDWWMLGGLALLVTVTGLITGIAHVGGFKHEIALDSDTLVYMKKLFWAAQPVGLVGSLLPKISIGLQLLYIMPLSTSFRWQRKLVWACIGLSTVNNLLVFPMVFAQCSPVAALWTGQGQCWSPEVNTIYFAIAALINGLVDIVLVSIPIAIILNLRISFFNKFMLIKFLGARLFASISSFTRAAYIIKNGFATNDFTWDAFDFLLWQTAEQFCLCFCGSFPTYKALFDRWLKRRASLKASGNSGPAYPRPASGQYGWFYEHKCFEDPSESGITVRTDIEIEVSHERLDSKENLPEGAHPMATTPTKKSDYNVAETTIQ